MSDEIIKKVLGTPVGVHTSALDEEDATLDADDGDGDGYVEVHEVDPKDWGRILEAGRRAEWQRLERTAPGRALKGLAESVCGGATARTTAEGAGLAGAVAAANQAVPGVDGVRASMMVVSNAAREVVVGTLRTVPAAASAVSAGMQVGGSYLRDEEPNWGEVVASAAWEGASWGTAIVFGAATTAAATAAYAPTGPVAPVAAVGTGVVVAWKTKELLDDAKDSLVRWGYSCADRW